MILLRVFFRLPLRKEKRPLPTFYNNYPQKSILLDIIASVVLGDVNCLFSCYSTTAFREKLHLNKNVEIHK